MAKTPKNQSAGEETATEEEAQQASSTVKMKRHGEGYKPPHTADVHLNEVDNWKKHGWELDDAAEA